MATTSLADPDRVPLAAIAKELGISVSTVYRWCLTGIRGRKLRRIRLGGRTFLRRDDVRDFIAFCSDPDASADDAAGTPAGCSPRGPAPPAAAQARADAANAECARLGL